MYIRIKDMLYNMDWTQDVVVESDINAQKWVIVMRPSDDVKRYVAAYDSREEALKVLNKIAAVVEAEPVG